MGIVLSKAFKIRCFSCHCVPIDKFEFAFLLADNSFMVSNYALSWNYFMMKFCSVLVLELWIAQGTWTPAVNFQSPCWIFFLFFDGMCRWARCSEGGIWLLMKCATLRWLCAGQRPKLHSRNVKKEIVRPLNRTSCKIAPTRSSASNRFATPGKIVWQ